MLRKLLCITATALVIPAGVAIASTGSAVALAAKRALPPVDASNYAISCSNFTGVMQFRPRIWGGLGPFTGNVKGKVSGCTAVPNDAGTPLNVVDGKVSGSVTFELTTDQTDCEPMLGYPNGTIYPTAGSLTVQWKTLSKSPSLSSGSSVIQPANLITQSGGGVDNLLIPGSTGGVSASGSFQGTDAGAGDSIVFDVDNSRDRVFYRCYDSPGITHLNFGGAAFDLG